MAAVARIYDWGNRVAWCAAVLSVPVYLFVLIHAGPQSRTAGDRDEAAATREIVAFCEKFGMPAGMNRHAQCVKDLTDIGARQRQQIADRAGRLY